MAKRTPDRRAFAVIKGIFGVVPVAVSLVVDLNHDANKHPAFAIRNWRIDFPWLWPDTSLSGNPPPSGGSLFSS
jgi:hypothetical protein